MREKARSVRPCSPGNVCTEPMLRSKTHLPPREDAIVADATAALSAISLDAAGEHDAERGAEEAERERAALRAAHEPCIAELCQRLAARQIDCAGSATAGRRV